MLQPLGLQSICAKTTFLVFFVVLEIAFEPFHMGFAFEGEDVGTDTVEEEAVVRDDHGAACEIDKGVFERAEGFDVKVVGRFVEEEDVAALFQQAGHMDAVAFTT